MTIWTAIVIMVAIFALVSVIRGKRTSHLGYPTDENGRPIGDPRTEAELRREIEELRERVQVLERIATDGGEAKRLSAEIERLRDEP